MKISPLDEIRILQSLRLLLKIQGDPKLNIAGTLRAYQMLTRDQQNEFWKKLNELTDISIQQSQRYFFFDYAKKGYSGDLGDIRPQIDKLIMQQIQQDNGKIEDASLLNVWKLARPICK